MNNFFGNDEECGNARVELDCSTPTAVRVQQDGEVRGEESRWALNLGFGAFCCRSPRGWALNVARFGVLFVVLTGVFPERYPRDVYMPVLGDGGKLLSGSMSFFGKVHLFGVLGGVIIPTMSCFCYFLWFAFRGEKLKGACLAYPVPGCAARALFILSIALYVYVFSLEGRPSSLDFCDVITTEAECTAWMRLNQTEVAAAAAECRASPADLAGPCDACAVDYLCAWREVTLSPLQASLLPEHGAGVPAGRCERTTCPLYENARSIALEYGALLLPLVYLLNYGLNDLAHLDCGVRITAIPLRASRRQHLVGSKTLRQWTTLKRARDPANAKVHPVAASATAAAPPAPQEVPPPSQQLSATAAGA
jgi:hypothetical protein